MEALCGEPLKRVVAQKQQRSVMEKFSVLPSKPAPFRFLRCRRLAWPLPCLSVGAAPTPEIQRGWESSVSAQCLPDVKAVFSLEATNELKSDL